MVIFLIKLALSDWQEWSDTLKKTNLQTAKRKKKGGGGYICIQTPLKFEENFRTGKKWQSLLY